MLPMELPTLSTLLAKLFQTEFQMSAMLPTRPSKALKTESLILETSSLTLVRILSMELKTPSTPLKTSLVKLGTLLRMLPSISPEVLSELVS